MCSHLCIARPSLEQAYESDNQVNCETQNNDTVSGSQIGPSAGGSVHGLRDRWVLKNYWRPFKIHHRICIYFKTRHVTKHVLHVQLNTRKTLPKVNPSNDSDVLTANTSCKDHLTWWLFTVCLPQHAHVHEQLPCGGIQFLLSRANQNPFGTF